MARFLKLRSSQKDTISYLIKKVSVLHKYSNSFLRKNAAKRKFGIFLKKTEVNKHGVVLPNFQYKQFQCYFVSLKSIFSLARCAMMHRKVL